MLYHHWLNARLSRLIGALRNTSRSGFLPIRLRTRCRSLKHHYSAFLRGFARLKPQMFGWVSLSCCSSVRLVMDSRRSQKNFKSAISNPTVWKIGYMWWMFQHVQVWPPRQVYPREQDARFLKPRLCATTRRSV